MEVKDIAYLILARCNSGNYSGSSSGTFNSPYYPDNYYNSMNCYYYVIIPQGMYVVLTFHDFDVEGTWDYLYVSIFICKTTFHFLRSEITRICKTTFHW